MSRPCPLPTRPLMPTVAALVLNRVASRFIRVTRRKTNSGTGYVPWLKCLWLGHLSLPARSACDVVWLPVGRWNPLCAPIYKPRGLGWQCFWSHPCCLLLPGGQWWSLVASGGEGKFALGQMHLTIKIKLFVSLTAHCLLFCHCPSGVTPLPSKSELE